MSTVVNARDVLLQAATTRLLTVALPGNTTVDFGNVNGATKPADNATVGASWGINLSGQPTSLGGINATEGSKLTGIAAGADVTLSAVNGGLAVTGGGITLSGGGSIKGGQTAYNTGTGFFLGYSGAAYKFSIGDTTHKLTWDGSALGIVGDISGASSLNITGNAIFGGSYVVGGVTYAVAANTSGVASGGVYGASESGGGVGVRGVTAFGAGVYGTANGSGGVGVKGLSTASGGSGVVASGSGGATALDVFGAMTIDNTTLVSNLNADLLDGLHAVDFVKSGGIAYQLFGTQTAGSGVATFDGTAKPGGNSTNIWAKTVIAGVTLYFPVWT